MTKILLTIQESDNPSNIIKLLQNFEDSHLIESSQNKYLIYINDRDMINFKESIQKTYSNAFFEITDLS